MDPHTPLYPTEIDEKTAAIFEEANGWALIGQVNEAAEAISSAEKHYWKHPKAVEVLAFAFAQAGRWEPAEFFARLLRGMCPREPAYLLHHVRALVELGRGEEAYGLFLPVADLNPGNGQCRGTMAAICESMGRREEALRWLAAEPDPEQDETRQNRL